MGPVQAGRGTDFIIGAPTTLAMSADFSGVPADWSAITQAAQRVTGRQGEVMTDQTGAYRWHESHGLGRTTVTATNTGLRVEFDRAGDYLAHWFGGLLAWAAASAALPLSLGPLTGALLFLLTPVVLARPFWRRSDNKARVRLEELAMELLRAANERVQ
ncbi:MAG: hypothetical protein HOD00_07805 [Gemmatimonadales bacterium]|nr:hypothetical protein [Gemmatimonadales bacterium]MBT3958266.1 hypothetical protein [Gemmatimonadales bacterium]MBT4187792.1 hypothetical protein [Gemmatimonadales bacterium]MBT4437421.1 hypothetical protein [Gemmatimonadales bacterium]MBT5044404.1 hypothetical protein [Gemmatimonadales bacterium]